MPKLKRDKKPYKERNDVEKIRSNWNKIKGLLRREEWSSAIVRAATTTEIAANLVVRKELIDSRNLDALLVDHFLHWANGIQGKFDKLILPTVRDKDQKKAFKALKKLVEGINLARNSIVHTGSFANKAQTHKIVLEAKAVIEVLLKPYYEDFELKDVE